MVILDEPKIDGSVICHNIPESEGVYVVTEVDGHVLYVGSSNCLRRRIAYLEAHVGDSSSGGYTHAASDPLIKLQASGEDVVVHFILCSDYKKWEQQLRKKYNPPWNKM